MKLAISIISLIVSIGIGIYNIKLNKKIYGPKIRVLFEKVYEYDKYGNFIENRYAKYNIILTNESINNIFNFDASFSFYGENGKIDHELPYDIGIFKETVPCFVPGQKYTSYFADFVELRNLGIKTIRFCFKYKIKGKGNKYSEENFDLNVISLSNNTVVRIERSS